MSKKSLSHLLAFSVLGIGAIFFSLQLSTSYAKDEWTIIPNQTKDTVSNTNTKIYFVGDMMLDRSVKKSVQNNFAGDYNKLFANVGELKNADILFGNLEGPISDVGNNVGSKYSFRMDTAVLPALINAGFDVLSFANNHVGDWNITAFKDTLKRLSGSSISTTGAGLNKTQAQTPVIIEKNGIKFGFLGFSDVGPQWMMAKESSAGILLANDPRFSEIISNAKKQVDVLIVSFHWGEEYKKIHNSRQEKLAYKAIDNGADMIIGHHPHVSQDIKTYKGKTIVYSLGNFIFDQYFSEETMHGMLFEATFEGSTLKNTHIRTIALNKSYQPEKIYDVATTKEVLSIRSRENACPKPKTTTPYVDYSYLDVGQDVAIPEKNYIPKDLILVPKSISTINLCLKKEASDALESMIAQAKKDGYNIKASSAFRSYATQKIILEQNIKNGNPNATIAVAKPGYSEHQLGVAVDITGSSIKNASASSKFQNTKEAEWVEKFGHEYGFIRSYPKDKQDITGYMYEAWHYRYVGLQYAKEIKESGQTINQFLKEKNLE